MGAVERRLARALPPPLTNLHKLLEVDEGVWSAPELRDLPLQVPSVCLKLQGLKGSLAQEKG